MTMVTSRAPIRNPIEHGQRKIVPLSRRRPRTVAGAPTAGGPDVFSGTGVGIFFRVVGKMSGWRGQKRHPLRPELPLVARHRPSCDPVMPRLAPAEASFARRTTLPTQDDGPHPAVAAQLTAIIRVNPLKWESPLRKIIGATRGDWQRVSPMMGLFGLVELFRPHATGCASRVSATDRSTVWPGGTFALGGSPQRLGPRRRIALRQGS